MSEADTDSTDEHLTGESTFFAQIDPKSEHFMKMDTNDDSSSSQDPPKELSSTSSDPFLLKDPEKDLKDESNKTTDSPKRVKLIRPEFDKEKLAQKIREIEEREKLKQLNKLKEQELSKSEEKTGETSTENKSEEAGKSEDLDTKNYVESEKELKNKETSTSKSTIDKLSKIDVNDAVLHRDESRDSIASTEDSGKKLNEESKVSTSVGDLKEIETVGVKSDTKPTPATSAQVSEEQKQDENVIQKNDVKAKDSVKEKIERDDQVSSNVGELKKETKVGEEETKNGGLERKVVFGKELGDPKKLGTSETDKATSSQNKVEMKPVEVSSTETAIASKDNINQQPKSVGSIDSTKTVAGGVKEVNIGEKDPELVEEDGKSKEKIEKEFDESKSKVQENLGSSIAKSVSSVAEVAKTVPNLEKPVKNVENPVDKLKSIESTSVVDVQQTVENVFDELTVEPSKAVDKSKAKPESKQQELTAVSEKMHADELSNKSDDILMEIEKFIDSSGEPPKKGPVEKLEANQKIVETSSKSVEKLAPTSSKRKLDDEVSNEDAKKKYTPTNVDSMKSKESTDLDSLEEKNILMGESMEVSESVLDVTDVKNKKETNVDCRSDDDKSSSKDSKDDDETKKGDQPLEKMLDSIIDFEPEPAEVPEEELVISDIPSTALIETKIPESPRRVKLVRPSKPVTKTLTKPEVPQKTLQTKSVEQKISSEIKDVPVKPVEKPQEVQEKVENIRGKEDTTKQDENTKKTEEEVSKNPDYEDAKKIEKEEIITVSTPKPSDKPVDLEKKLIVSKEKTVVEKTKAEEMEIGSLVKVIPTVEKETVLKTPIVEKLTTDKPTISSAPIIVETASVEQELKLHEKNVEKVEELLHKQEKIVSKEPEKDISSDKLPLETSVAEKKISERKSEPKSVEKTVLLKSTEPPPPSITVKEDKIETEIIEKSVSEEAVATPKINTSEVATALEISANQSAPSKIASREEAVKETVVTKEPIVKSTEVSKIPQASSPKKNDSTQEKASPGESEVSKLRRIIRKPKLDSSNDNKQAETVTSTSVAHDVENKQEILSKQSSEVEKDVVLDMTVDEEGEEEGEKAVTSTETKQEKQLGFKLKIAKSSSTIIPKGDKSIPSASILAEKLLSQKSTEHTFGSITISATSSKQQTNIKKVEQMLKDTDVTITPLVGRESVQKLDKITLKIGKDGNPPEIKQTGSTEVKRKQVEKGGGGDDVGSPTRKKMKDESAVLTTSAGVEIDLHLKKSKLLSSLIAEPPMSAQDPRMLMAQQMMAQTSQQIMGLSPQQQSMFQQMMSQGQSSQQMMNPGQMMQQMMMGQASGQQMIQQMLAQGLTPQQIMQQVLGQGQQTSQQMMMGQQMMNHLTPQQANIFLGSPQTSGSSYPGTPGSEVVKKKRGRPRKIPILEGQHPQDQQVAALKQQIMMQSQQGSSGTGTSSGSGGSEEYSSGVFPQVPLFDMTESLFDQPHLFPNQVNAMQGGERGRPQRSCRGRVKLPSVRSRKPRGSTMAVRAGVGRGRGRGRGYKRVEPEFVESDNIITLENVKEEMRRQSMEQSQFLSGNEPMEIQPSQDPTSLAAPGQDSNLMKSPEKKPRKRRTEEQERERIEKMKQKREEKKMKTLEKKRKIAEARAREKAAVMAAALVEEETRMSAPERKEEAERKKEVKTEEEKKVEGETDVSLKEEPSEPEPNSVLEADEVSQQSLDTKEAVQLEKEVIETEESQEPSTPISKPDLVDVTSNSCDESVKVEHSSFQDIKKESSTNTDTVERSPSCFVTPRKEKKIYRCLICREESALKKLTSPLDHRSWRVLYQAAIVRGHEEIINLTKNLSDEIPSGILYHRNCRSEFTHKKTLAKLTDTPLPEDGHHHHHHHHHHTPTAAKTTGAENINPNTPKDVRMEGTITEYQWPLQGGELYMIQEQVSDFLEITSFKRKYPDIFRRTVDPEEKAYLRENGLVSEAHCDLGLIAVKSSDILDIMFADFQDKYEEFRKQIRDKQARELSSKHKAAFNCLLLDKRKFDNRVLDAKTEAMQAVAAWNSRLNKTRTEERRCMLDLQSMIVHYPRTVGVKRSQVPNPPDKVGHYPVALVPGQFCDHYKKYNSNELKYFPLNTVIYGPMKPNERFGGGSDGSQTDTDSSTSSDDSSDSSSDSSDDSSGSGDESNDKMLTSAAGAKDRQPSGETHCKMCGGDKTRNKQDNPEVLINCAQCTKSSQLMQLNRLPTVLLSNISSVRSPIKTSSSNSSLSKLLKPTVNSPSPVKRFKTETGFIATDPSKPRVLGTGSTNNVTRVLGTGPTNVARVLGTGSPNVVNVLGTSTTGSPNVVRVLGTETPKTNVVRVLGTTGSSNVATVLGTETPKSNVTRVLGTGTPVKVLGADSTKPNVVRVLGTQVVKVQGSGGTQFVRTQEGQNIRVQNVQEGQSIRVMGTQIVKPQEVTGAQNIRVMGTQIVKPQDVKVTGTQEAQMGTQIVNPQEVSGTQIVNPQEPQNIMGPKPVETQSEGVQQTQTLKPQVSPLRGIRRFSQISESQQKVKVEIDQAVQSIKTEVDQAVQSITFDDNQTEQSIKIEESQIVENQSNKLEASQNVEVQSVETQDSLKEIQDVQTQDSLKDVETQEISSVKVGDSQNDEVAEEQCILESRRLEAQNIQTQETESVETPGSQNVETEYIKPSPEQIMNSDSNTSNSTLQSNTVSSESIVTVDKGDTVSSTVDTEMG